MRISWFAAYQEQNTLPGTAYQRIFLIHGCCTCCFAIHSGWMAVCVGRWVGGLVVQRVGGFYLGECARVRIPVQLANVALRHTWYRIGGLTTSEPGLKLPAGNQPVGRQLLWRCLSTYGGSKRRVSAKNLPNRQLRCAKHGDLAMPKLLVFPLLSNATYP